jgi:hypothetical protein
LVAAEVAVILSKRWFSYREINVHVLFLLYTASPTGVQHTM